MPLIQPKQWSSKQLVADAAQSRNNFRVERLDEEPDDYRKYYKAYRPVVKRLAKALIDIKDGSQNLTPLLTSKEEWAAFRYVAAPPISADDLATLADVKVDRNFLGRPKEVARVRDIVIALADPFRFPWLKKGKAPTDEELELAVASTSAMLAASTIATDRRNAAKAEQEQAVKDALEAAGFKSSPTKTEILNPAVGPPPGHYCGETKFGGTKADIVARLRDHRVLVIECKASNSEVNSYKRVNHEAAGKARTWLKKFGEDGVVPAATISGVFKPANLESAQKSGLNLFWQFRLDDLGAYVKAVK